MSKNRKTPDLADWRVCFTNPAQPALTVRAVSLQRSASDYVLDDGTGCPLFTAPVAGVLYVKRLEPSLDVPAAKEEAPKETEGAPSSDPPMDVLPPAVPPLARRKRSGTRG